MSDRIRIKLVRCPPPLDTYQRFVARFKETDGLGPMREHFVTGEAFSGEPINDEKRKFYVHLCERLRFWGATHLLE